MNKYLIKKQDAIAMRLKGCSLGQIVERLSIPRGTVYSWISGLKLNGKSRKRLEMKKREARDKARLTLRSLRMMEMYRIRKRVGSELDTFRGGESECRMLASILFWTEGSKQLNSLQFMNSDTSMMKLFIYCLRRGFVIDEKKFRVLLHLHEYHDEEKLKLYWSQALGISLSHFTKTYRKPHTGRRKHPDYMGSCKLKYYDSRLARELTVRYLEITKKVLALT